MNNRRVLYPVMLSLVFLLLASGLSACGGPSSPEGDAGNAFTVLSIAGKVLVMKPGDTEWSAGTAGMTLGADYKIKTEAGGHATITFFEGSTIELESATEITLSELSLDGSTTNIRIAQTLGKTVSRVKNLLDPASSYEVETTSAVAAVRGTEFYVSVTSSGVTTVGNTEGKVSVIAQGVEVVLPEGTRTKVSPGKPPGQPEPDITTQLR